MKGLLGVTLVEERTTKSFRINQKINDKNENGMISLI